MTMPGMPTISLRITCKGNTLGDIDALPVPVSVTPSGHLVCVLASWRPLCERCFSAV